MRPTTTEREPAMSLPDPAALDVPDSAPIAELRTAGLLLQPVRYDAPLSMGAVPVVTACELSRYIAAWRAADPNGTWGTVTEHRATGDDGAPVWVLAHVRADVDSPDLTDGLTLAALRDSEADYWTSTEVSSGVVLYPLGGWVWFVADRDAEEWEQSLSPAGPVRPLADVLAEHVAMVRKARLASEGN